MGRIKPISTERNLGSIIAFILGLNLPRSVLLSNLSLIASSLIFIGYAPHLGPLKVLGSLKRCFRDAYRGPSGSQARLALASMLIFGVLATSSGLTSHSPRLPTHAVEFIIILPLCMSLATSRLNSTPPCKASRLAIAYSMGSLVYVVACLLNTRMQGGLDPLSLFFRQSHNELIAPWGHSNNTVNIRTIEQSLLFPISLLPVSLVGAVKDKERKNWILGLAIGTIALVLSRGFGSGFPLLVLAISSIFALASTFPISNILKALFKPQKAITIASIAVVVTAAAGAYILTRHCVAIDERFSRVLAAIRYLPILPQANRDLAFSYHEICTNRTISFMSSEGDSLHNVFLDYSLQFGVVAGISLLACALFLSYRFFSEYFNQLKDSTKGSENNKYSLGIIASTISTSWVLWLSQPVASSNFSMLILSLYYLAICSAASISSLRGNARQARFLA